MHLETAQMVAGDRADAALTIEARLDGDSATHRAAAALVRDRAGGRPASPAARTAPRRGDADDAPTPCAAPSGASR